MPSGKRTEACTCLRVLKLLRQARRPGSQLKRSRIPHVAGIHRETVTAIIEQAAVKWLEIVEAAERADDLEDRGR